MPWSRVMLTTAFPAGDEVWMHWDDAKILVLDSNQLTRKIREAIWIRRRGAKLSTVMLGVILESCIWSTAKKNCASEDWENQQEKQWSISLVIKTSSKMPKASKYLWVLFWIWSTKSQLICFIDENFKFLWQPFCTIDYLVVWAWGVSVNPRDTKQLIVHSNFIATRLPMLVFSTTLRTANICARNACSFGKRLTSADVSQ